MDVINILLAVAEIIKIAADKTHGYTQDADKRWGPDYDCATLVITALLAAGIDLRALGATYTGDMSQALRKAGAVNIIKKINLKTGEGLLPGDVLLRPKTASKGGHAAMVIGAGRIAHAVSNENGGISGGKTGDQTGREIREDDYYNSPWTEVWRFEAKAEPAPSGDEPGTMVGRVTAENLLNVRATPGLSGKVLHRVKTDTVMRFNGRREVAGRWWYRNTALHNGAEQWVSSYYIKRTEGVMPDELPIM